MELAKDWPWHSSDWSNTALLKPRLRIADFFYRLNRHHVLASAVINACEVRAEISSRIEQEVDLLSPQPVHGSIFGSFARGGGTPESDIDMLFLVADRNGPDDTWYAQLQLFADKMCRWTGNRVEYLAFNETEFQKVLSNREPVVDSWLD